MTFVRFFSQVISLLRVCQFSSNRHWRQTKISRHEPNQVTRQNVINSWSCSSSCFPSSVKVEELLILYSPSLFRFVWFSLESLRVVFDPKDLYKYDNCCLVFCTRAQTREQCHSIDGIKQWLRIFLKNLNFNSSFASLTNIVIWNGPISLW